MTTRALRIHLDTLPVDYRLDVTPDRFLAGLAFMSARHRYDCAESMIGAGFGGTVLGSISRSIFIDGLRWLWIGEAPERRRFLLGDLIEQRNRICIDLEEADATCPVLSRWLMPLPDVAGLTGQSLAWINVQALPSEEELLDGYLAGANAVAPSSEASTAQATLIQRAATLLDMSGLRGAVMVLAHAGHGNYLGLQSSTTQEGAVGHDLRADHEALFMHVAAVGVTATLLGSAVALPDLWPPNVAQEPFLQTAVDLAEGVTKAAVAIHRLAPAGVSVPKAKKKVVPQQAVSPLRPQAVLTAADLLPDIVLYRAGCRRSRGILRSGPDHADRTMGLRDADISQRAGLWRRTLWPAGSNVNI